MMRFSLLVILANNLTRRPIFISLKRNVGLKNKIGSALGMHGRHFRPRRCEQTSRTSPAISDQTAKEMSENCRRLNHFTKLSRVRHLVVTVCCFDPEHDPNTQLQMHEETQDSYFFDFRSALHERLCDTENGAHLARWRHSSNHRSTQCRRTTQSE